MASIARLVVSLGAQTSSFETDMARANRNQAKRMKQMKTDAAAAAKGLAVAFAAVSGAMVAVVRSTTQTADEMQKLALRTGITTEALSQYKHVAELSGLSFDQFTNGMKRMSRSISDAEVGLSTQTRAFERLGISVDELMQMNPDRQFETIAQAMVGLESATLRSATAQEIFGRSGTEMLSMMAYGEEGIKSMREEADRLGLTIGQDLADASALFNDNITRMTGLAKGAGIQFTTGLLPGLIGVQEYFLKDAEASDMFARAGEWLADVIKRLISAFIVMKGIATALGKALVGVAMAIYNSFKAVFLAVKRPIDQLAKALDELVKGNIKGAMQALADAPKAMADGWNEGAQAVYDSLAFIGTGLEDVEESIESAFDLLNSKAREVQAPLFEVGGAIDGVSESAENLEGTVEDVIEVTEGLPIVFEDAANSAGDSFDAMTTAMDEGVRILEGAFTSMWDGLLDGSEDAFDSIKDGFKSLLSSLIHQATTQKIMLNIQSGMQGTGTGANGGINWGQLGTDIAQFAAVIIGTKLGGGGEYAATGAGLGALAGGIVGSVIPVIGTAIGAAIGSVLGGLLGGLFDKSKNALLDLSGYSRAGVSKSDKDSSFGTAFGTTYVRSRHVNPEAMAEITSAIQEFDSSIASFLDDSQIEKITESLKSWQSSMKAESLSMEQFIDSRFGAILRTFSDEMQDFVKRGEDIGEQINRLQIAVTADNILKDAPGLFSGKTVTDFLNVVEGFQDGAETITDAFKEVLNLLDIISAVQASLRDYSNSNLGDDYAAMVYQANMSLSEAVAGMQSALMDAIAAFDGSPEQLQNIGAIAMAVREGELKLLAQIDSIQQGINANLDDLQAKISGLNQPDATAEEIFREANQLIANVRTAQSPEELAAIEQRFTGLINAINPEDQAALQQSILNLIEGFRESINLVLDTQRDDALANGESSRDLVDIFLNDIGDPLDVLANSNVQVVEELGNIDDTLNELGPTMSGAIRDGFRNANVSVNVIMSDGGLVNE